DPPLLLGFLKGVPLLWTLRLWPQMLTVTLALLALFNAWDQVVLNREERERRGSQLEQVMVHEPLRLAGAYNLLFLAAVIATIVGAGHGAAHGRPSAFGAQEAVVALVAATAAGQGGVAAHGAFLGTFLAAGPGATRTLAAIATGAVFMGAATYIGNAPNFMVKAIAEENGIRMPTFAGYLLYSVAILGPVFVATTLLFFR